MDKETALKNFILDQSESLFVNRGYNETSMEMIAESCGISKPTLYNYFNSKYELFSNLSRRLMTDIFDKWSVLAKQPKSRWEMIEDIIEYSTTFVEEKRGFFRMMMRESHQMVHPNVEQHLIWFADINERIVNLLEELLTGIIRPEVKRKYGIHIAASTIYYILQGYLYDRILSDDKEILNKREFILHLLKRGMLREEV